MSVADVQVESGAVVRVLPTAHPRRRVSTRLLRSELGMIFRRRRNQMALLVLMAVPVLIGVAIKMSSGDAGGGPPFFNEITNNGVFVAFAAVTVVIPLFLPLVGGYVGLCMTALGAIGLFVSTLTETPVAAMTATATLAVISQVLDALPQVHAIHRYLPSHYWLNFGDLMRDPIAWSALRPGLVCVAVYVAIFGSLAWARFTGKDVSS